LAAEAELATERTQPLVAEAVKTSPIPPVKRSGKIKAKQIKKVEIIGAN
jgi:hypothetical protein